MLTEKVESLDEVWENAELEEEKEEKEEEKETAEKETEEKEEQETEEKAEEEKAEEETEEKEEKEEQEEEKEAQVDWKKLGFDKFEGKTDREVVDQIKFERQQLGHTVNMLGDLRREIADLKKPPVKEPEKPKDVLGSIPELDDADAAKFNAMYEKNPIKAIMTYGGDPIKQMVADAVKEQMPKGSVEDVKAEIAYSTFISTAKPKDVEVEQMQIFDKEEYLGKQNRSYDDLFGISKMWLTNEAGSEDIYNLMKKHPTLSFSEACSFVIKPKLEVKKVKIDKEKIKETINKNKKADSHPKKKAKAMPANDLSFDEAWEQA